MNESIDSISNFFNKLLNIKTKDQSSNSSSSKEISPRESNLSASNQSTTKSTSKTKDQMKTTNKLTIDSLKAGLSDILDETSDYLNSITSVNSQNNLTENHPPASTSPIKDENLNKEKIKIEYSDKVHLAIDLTNEKDVKCFLETECNDAPIEAKESFLKNKEHISNKTDDSSFNSVNEKKNNLVKKTLKNEEFLSIQLDDKVNEKSSSIEGQQIAAVTLESKGNSNSDLNTNLNAKLNDLNKDTDSEKSILSIQSTGKLNSEKSSNENDYLPENGCFLMPDLLGTSKDKFEEIDLKCVKDVKEANLNANKEQLAILSYASKENYSKNGKKEDEKDHVAKDQSLSKQEMDEENNSEMVSIDVFIAFIYK